MKPGGFWQASGRWVVLFAALLFLWRLGSHDLWAPDEPYFAEGAREMVVDGQWAVPHVNGVVTTDKPPLFFWLIALFSLPLGEVNSWTARLPSALAALGTVWLTMRLGARWYGAKTAALAGVILATTLLFWTKARWSQTDALLCLCIWTALSAFEAFRSGVAKGRGAGVLFWFAMALAVLAKGPVGLLLPLGIALVVLAWDRDLASWRRFAPLTGPLVFSLVAGAWIVFTELAGPESYSVWGALKEHFVDRGVHGMHHKQPPWYFLETLPPNLLPWTGLIPGALLLAWRRRTAGDRFAFSVAAFVLIFFSISTEKRELYALPAVPAFALMAAALVAVVCGWDEPRAGEPKLLSRRWATVGHGAVAGILLLAAVAVGLAASRFPELPKGVAVTLGAALAGTAVGIFYALHRRRFLNAVLTAALGMGLTLLVASTLVPPFFEPRKSARPFALRIKEVTAESRSSGLSVVTYELGNLPEPFAFYSDGMYTRETNDPEVLIAHLDRPEPVFAVANGGKLASLPPGLANRLRVVDSTRLARRDVLLLANHPYPDARPLLETAGRE